MKRTICATLLFAIVACSPGTPDDTDGTWVGTITTEGNVTTVVNESGSVWGGTARLVEEASIGVEAGADEYMLSSVFSVFGTDEHIYVVDMDGPRLVRRYDHDGVYVDTIGARGQGPGEYMAPGLVTVAPDGRILVLDPLSSRTQVYGPDGESLGYWPVQNIPCCSWRMMIGSDGALWMPMRTRFPDSREVVHGIQPFGPDGPMGDHYSVRGIDVPELYVTVRGREENIVPFAPWFIWTPVGAELIMAGASDRYRFEVQLRGETVLVVEKYWEPVPIDPEDAEWRRKATSALGRQVEPGWIWNGSGMPEHHPAFGALVATTGGEFWVARFGPSRRVADCVEEPLAEGIDPDSVFENACWRDVLVLDAFDQEGRYLGEIDTPVNMQLDEPRLTHVVGDRVIGVEMDDFGLFMVKRYRLVLPGER